MENLYIPVRARIDRVVEETPTIKTLVLRPEEEFRFNAGQFMQVSIPGVGEAPFTPSSSPFETERMEITVLRTGALTDLLHEVGPGDTVGLRGPFGKGYPLDSFKGRDVLIVGGGVGLAPLRSLIYYLIHEIGHYARVSIKYGAKRPGELVFRREFGTWQTTPNLHMTITIDTAAEGWTGRVGLVTTLLEGGDIDVDINTCYAVSCGPEIMLKFVTFKLLDLGIAPERIYLSMNRRMSCGVGKCGRCNIGHLLICRDGPDMNYAEIKDLPHVFP